MGLLGGVEDHEAGGVVSGGKIRNLPLGALTGPAAPNQAPEER